MNAKGWRPFWAALLAGLLVLVPLVGGTVLLTRRTLRTKLASRPQSGVAIRQSISQYTGNILLIAVNYDKKTKQHECMIEPYHAS